MKKQKVKLSGLRVKSFITSTPSQIKAKAKKNGGGYTWVG